MTTEFTSNRIQGEPPNKQLHIIALKHCKQKYNWDCGIACVLMVLPYNHRDDLLANFTDVCQDEGFNRSTWTIDLCYLLQRYNVRHSFYTVTLGVHPGYRWNSFYHHILTKDESRVNARFERARNAGLRVNHGSIKCTDIIDHLVMRGGGGPVIVLTNASLIHCDICKLNKISSELRKCIPWPTRYQGHYIVLCGYDIATRKIYYRNPSFNDRICMMSLDAFETARTSYGTDEDVILVYN